MRNLTFISLVFVGATCHGCARPAGKIFPTISPALVWPKSPDLARIKLIGTIADSTDLRAARTGAEGLAEFFRGPRQAIRLGTPVAIAVRQSNLVAVADVGRAGVHIIDLEQRTHRLVTGWADERFSVPAGVAWGGDRLFVTDAARGEIIVLYADGIFVSRFGAEHLDRPVGITFCAARNHLYVVDGDAHDIEVFDTQGRHQRTLGRRGATAGTFNFPSHISCRDECLIVADSGNFRVQLLDLDGNCITTIGQKGDGAGDFALPKGVGMDSEGHVYVVDAQFENIQLFDRDGRLLLGVGGEGRSLGEFWLPAGLAIDQRDRIWVADSGNQRIQVFAYLKATS